MKEKYDLSIYDIGIINKAILDYDALATIRLTITDNFAECNFENCKYDTQMTIDEFGNYLIDLMES